MNKTIKTLTMLGAVSALAACGGISWQKSDFEGVKAVAAQLDEDKVVEALDLANGKFAYTVTSISKETAKGVFSSDELNSTTFEFDVPNLKIHLKGSTKEEYKDEVDPSENKSVNEAEDIWFSYTDKNGVVSQMNDGDSKVYTTIMTKEEVEQAAAAEEKTAKEYLQASFLDTAYSMINLGTIYNGFLGIAECDDADEYVGSAEGETLVEKYYVAKEGDLKFSIEQKYSYDDGYAEGYDVDVTYLVKGEMNKWFAKDFINSYKETGKYYVTETEKVDYTYESTSTAKCSKKASISVPSLKGYTETTAK